MKILNNLSFLAKDHTWRHQKVQKKTMETIP